MDHTPRKFARLPAIQEAYGLPRSRVYDLLSRGAIRARKDGRALLIEVESVEAYFAALPGATIRSARPCEAVTAT